EPTTECWETATFNNTTCVWDVTGTQALEPTTECWETATFNNTTCSWIVTGTQDPIPTGLECWETANFDTPTCSWIVTGTPTTYYLDSDGDGFGDINNTIQDCSTPIGYTDNSNDCDDANNAVNPDAIEILCNGIDENCNGMADDFDTIIPICNTQDITVMLDTFGNATISANQIDNGSSDNCGIDTISVTPSNFNTSHIGDNSVSLTVTDNNGNSTNCNATVTIEENTLRNPEFDNTEVRIYPNPFNNQITIQLSSHYNNTDFQINILDLNGRIVFNKIVTSSNNKIVIGNLDKLEEAPYFIKVTNTENGESIMRKLLKFD
ncbi:hypothetical protein A9Q87_10945, partial [Flavobacteriales bacterium 34_180_T64]